MLTYPAHIGKMRSGRVGKTMGINFANASGRHPSKPASTLHVDFSERNRWPRIMHVMAKSSPGLRDYPGVGFWPLAASTITSTTLCVVSCFVSGGEPVASHGPGNPLLGLANPIPTSCRAELSVRSHVVHLTQIPLAVFDACRHV